MATKNNDKRRSVLGGLFEISLCRCDINGVLFGIIIGSACGRHYEIGGWYIVLSNYASYGLYRFVVINRHVLNSSKAYSV
jgi:hypothetical protein